MGSVNPLGGQQTSSAYRWQIINPLIDEIVEGYQRRKNDASKYMNQY
jgi:hypothetical protein